MRYTCAHKPRCTHAAVGRTMEIPTGEEEWVETRLEGNVAYRSHHRDCIGGLFFVARDGKKVSPYFVDENYGFEWLLRHQGQSVDRAVRYEGYSFAQVEA